MFAAAGRRTVREMDRWIDFDLIHDALPGCVLDSAARRELEVLALMAEPRRPVTDSRAGRRWPRIGRVFGDLRGAPERAV